MKNEDEIRVAEDGRVMLAPVGTAAPADIATAFGAGWVDAGYTDENGVSFRITKTKVEIPAWQSFFKLREIIQSRGGSLVMSLIQWSKDTVPFAFGGGAVTETALGSGVFKYEPPSEGETDERAMAVEWEDGAYTYRLFIPRGNVSEGLETNLTRTTNSKLPITFEILGSAGVKPFYLLTNDPAFDPAA